MARLLADVLELLACPACHGPLKTLGEATGGAMGTIACGACRRVYPVRDGIPVLVAAEAVVGESVSRGGTVIRET